MKPIIRITYQPPAVQLSINGAPLTWPYPAAHPIDEWGICVPEENWKGLHAELAPLLKDNGCVICYTGPEDELFVLKVLLKELDAEYLTEEELAEALAAEKAARQAVIEAERERAEAERIQAEAQAQQAAQTQSAARMKRFIPVILIPGALLFVGAVLLLILLLHRLVSGTNSDDGNIPETTITAAQTETSESSPATETTKETPDLSLSTAATVEIMEVATTTETAFEIPQTASCLDDAGNTITGNLESIVDLDLELDGRMEKAAKYYSSKDNLYFYQIYKNDSFYCTTVPSTGMGCGTSYDFFLTDQSGRRRLASLVMMDCWFICYYTGYNGSYMTYERMVSMSSGYYWESDFTIREKPATFDEVLDYMYSLGFEKDKRDIPGMLQDNLEAVAESLSSPDTTEAASTSPSASATAASTGKDLDEIDTYYRSMIEMNQESIKQYESDPNYDPSLVGADAQYYKDMAAELSREQALLERSGDTAGARALQDDIDACYEIAERIYITNTYHEEILDLQEEIEELEMEWAAARR